jgi:hypothetical protein
MFVLSVLASLLTGIGVNVVTGDPNNWMGWVMIISGVVHESVVFVAIPK